MIGILAIFEDKLTLINIVIGLLGFSLLALASALSLWKRNLLKKLKDGPELFDTDIFVDFMFADNKPELADLLQILGIDQRKYEPKGKTLEKIQEEIR